MSLATKPTHIMPTPSQNTLRNLLSHPVSPNKESSPRKQAQQSTPQQSTPQQSTPQHHQHQQPTTQPNSNSSSQATKESTIKHEPAQFPNSISEPRSTSSPPVNTKSTSTMATTMDTDTSVSQKYEPMDFNDMSNSSQDTSRDSQDMSQDMSHDSPQDTSQDTSHNTSQDTSHNTSQDTPSSPNAKPRTSRSSRSSRAIFQGSIPICKPTRDYPRKRRRTSPNELFILESEFRKNNRPDKIDRERIASITNMHEKAVQIWFQNKRQSCRRNQNHNMPTFGACLAVRTQSAPVYQDENKVNPNRVLSSMSSNFNHAVGLFPTTTTSQNIPHLNSLSNANANQKPLVPVNPNQQPSQLSNGINGQNKSAIYTNSGQQNHTKRAKSLRLSMSADGKAEIVERSPLKQLDTNQQSAAPATKAFSMPVELPNINGMESECVSSLLVLKSGQWS